MPNYVSICGERDDDRLCIMHYLAEIKTEGEREEWMVTPRSTQLESVGWCVLHSDSPIKRRLPYLISSSVNPSR